MDIAKLFSGIAVIIDDEINTADSSASVIKSIIQNRNIPVAVYDSIPKQDIIPALAKASMIILDWDYTKGLSPLTEDERIMIPDVYTEALEDELMEFIKTLILTVFAPVFIFTYKNPTSIEEKLQAAGLWHYNKPGLVFIKQKDEIQTEEELFGAIEDWLKAMPSMYVLKEWDNKINDTKNNMFKELFDYSPDWTKIIWDLLKNDTIEYQREFGEFVTRSLVNRIDNYMFDEIIIDSRSNAPIDKNELQQVIQGERYMRYRISPVQVYTGDLFKDGQKYYLNVRAQCDLSRRDTAMLYNPILFCIKGERLRIKDIATEEIQLSHEGQLLFGTNKRFSIDEMQNIYLDEVELQKFNRNFIKYRNSVFFHKGALLERTNKVIIGCVADELAIQFDLSIVHIKFDEIKEKRIGRVLPPLITHIQQKCSQYMIREGVIPFPSILFEDYEN